MKIGYQLYSARDDMQRDFAGTLRAVKEMGYDGVEFAGFFGHSAADVKAMLAEQGLEAVSSHVPMDTIIEDPAGTIAYHLEIGCKFIVVPYLAEEWRPGKNTFSKAIGIISAFGAQCKAAGITLLYHNHDFEFVAISDEYALDFIYNAIPADFLKTEIDTCWVRVAGEDPANYIHKYAGRCPIVHLKDYIGEKTEGAMYALIKADGGDDVEVNQSQAFDFRPVGYGVQDVPAILKAGVESGADWFIVEQDRSSQRPALEAAKMSIEYLRNL